MKITFNTSRQYTALGQVITVLILDYNQQCTTLFKDHSRLICGEIKALPPTRDPEDVARWVMQFYDGGKYQMSIDAINLDQVDTIHKYRI